MKRIGLLETDVASPSVKAHFQTFVDVFSAYFSGVPDIEFVPYRIMEMNFPQSPSTCDAWIIPGSRLSVYERKGWTAQLEDFIRTAVEKKVPTLGICYGHQFMAQAFGGKVEKANAGRGVGSHTYMLTDGGKKTFPGMKEITLPVAHQDQVTLQPPNTTLLAFSSFCPIAALQYEKGPALSIQAHPEFTIGVARSIAEDWERDAPLRDGTLERAQQSLSLPVDSAHLRPVLAKFLLG